MRDVDGSSGKQQPSHPNLLVRFRRSDRARKLGRRLEKGAKKLLFSVLDRVLPEKRYALSDLRDVSKVLMVRPNFRIGNTLISARLIPSIRARFPGARIDVLGAETTLTLLENLGLERMEALSRSHAYRWFSFMGMIRRLRKARYDVAIDAGAGSLTSALLTSLVGARYRVGEDRGGARRLLNVRVSTNDTPHVYDALAAFAGEVGGELPQPIPHYKVSEPERRSAVQWLCDKGAGENEKPKPLLAVFVGGHLDKRLPKDFWQSLLKRLAKEGVRILLFSGPEELALIEDIDKMKLPNVRIVPTQHLRKTAALCALADLVVSPDTGTLHLAAALEVPVVSLLQVERSKAYAPKGERDRVLMRPSVDEVVHALTTHPNWPGPRH